MSVEISTSYKGRIRKAVSKNDTLIQEQKAIMKLADPGTDILVTVQYLPENTLKQKDVKEMDFKLFVDPDSEANYSGGQQQLKQYLKDSAINKIPDDIFRKYQLAAVKFTVNEEGQIIDPHVFWPSDDDKIDELLLETIRQMPGWEPAEYANGKRVKQEFVFAVGDMESCVVNLLNISQ
jgi:hypothetical protein